MNISLTTFIKWRERFFRTVGADARTKVVQEFSELFIKNLTEPQVFRLLGGNNFSRIARLIEDERSMLMTNWQASAQAAMQPMIDELEKEIKAELQKPCRCLYPATIYAEGRGWCKGCRDEHIQTSQEIGT